MGAKDDTTRAVWIFLDKLLARQSARWEWRSAARLQVHVEEAPGQATLPWTAIISGSLQPRCAEAMASQLLWLLWLLEPRSQSWLMVPGLCLLAGYVWAKISVVCQDPRRADRRRVWHLQQVPPLTSMVTSHSSSKSGGSILCAPAAWPWSPQQPQALSWLHSPARYGLLEEEVWALLHVHLHLPLTQGKLGSRQTAGQMRFHLLGSGHLGVGSS